MANTSTLGLPKPDAANPLIEDVERIKTSFDGFDAAIAARATQSQLTAHAGNQQNPHGTTAAQTGAIPAASDSVTDGYIGTRTLDPSQTATSNAGNLTALLSSIAGRVRAIMGTTNWYDSPPVSLQATQSHIAAQTNPHATTAAQVGAIPASGGSVNDTYIGARTASLIVAPSAQSNNGVELTTWLGWIINRIRAITGTTNWYDAPATTLSGAASHHANTGNPHGTTAAQVGAPTTSGVGATGTWGISISGTAASAAKLSTPRTINGTSFDGTANITVPAKLVSLQSVTLDYSGTTGWTSGGEFSSGSYRDYTITSVTAANCVTAMRGTMSVTTSGTERSARVSIVNPTTLRLSINYNSGVGGPVSTVIVGSVQIAEFV